MFLECNIRKNGHALFEHGVRTDAIRLDLLELAVSTRAL